MKFVLILPSLQQYAHVPEDLQTPQLFSNFPPFSSPSPEDSQIPHKAFKIQRYRSVKSG